jgi:hypothetical protein
MDLKKSVKDFYGKFQGEPVKVYIVSVAQQISL